MKSRQVLQQSVWIEADIATVDRCITDRDLMHRWLNPLLRCDPVGEWSTAVESESRFLIQIPLLQPTLKSVVVERGSGLVVWEFDGFFQGRDRWECALENGGTRLVNTFTFEIPNPFVKFGFNTFAAGLTQADMRSQLQRLKQVAEAE